MGLLDAFKDKQFRDDVADNGINFLRSASNAAATNVTGPVDMLAWALRKAGLPIPDAPTGGSNWAKNVGLLNDVQHNPSSIAGETIGLLAPVAMTAGAPKIAKGLLQMADNAAAPRMMNPETGAIVLNGQPVRKQFAYPQDKALATAQKNAALPIEQGGLGLHPNNTPLERAKAMGFSDNAFHGTSSDFRQFNTGGTGKTSESGAFFSENPHAASTYASRDGGNVVPVMLRQESPVHVSTNGANWNWIGKSAKVDAPKINTADKEGDALMAGLFGDSTTATVEKKAFKKPVSKLFPDSFKYDDHISTDDLARWANKEGYGSIVFDSVKDRGPNGIFANAEAALPSKNTAVFNPENIRSRFAAFDPMRRDSADILAGLLPVGVLSDEETRNQLIGKILERNGQALK